jgi:predicted negative regulator of RcsB-dependent stress response
VDDLLSEKEQIDQMRAWWSDYGNYVIGGIVLGALALFGWNYYGDSTREMQTEASSLYGDLAGEIDDGDLDEAEALYGQLVSDYGDSAYAAQGRLVMARMYMDQNRDEDAADTLRDLLASTAGDEFKQVARLRLAKILLYQDEPQQVIDLLDAANEDDAFAARYDEVRGDAYVALERVEDARAAYERALGNVGQAGTINQEYVQLKLLDLPFENVQDVPADAAAEPATGETGAAGDPDVDEGDAG